MSQIGWILALTGWDSLAVSIVVVCQLFFLLGCWFHEFAVNNCSKSGCMHPGAEATGDKTKYFLKKKPLHTKSNI
jgi:hypothetical protein